MQRRIAKQWSHTMIPAEAEVWDSLTQAGYKFQAFFSGDDEDDPTSQDFTLTADLYEVYTKYRRRTFTEVSDPDLNSRQFGVALNAVTEDTLIRSRRWVNLDGKRKQAWGYQGVKGPKSHRVNKTVGRPSTQCHDSPRQMYLAACRNHR